MKNKFKLVMVATIGLMVVLASCKKNDENDENGKNEDEPQRMVMTTAKSEIWIALWGWGKDSATIDWGDGSPKETKLIKVEHSWPEFIHNYENETMHTITITGKNILQMMCQGNQLKTLDVSKNPALIGLFCNKNQLKSLDVNGLPNLEELFCDENQLISLTVNGLSELKSIYCGNNQLTSLDLSGLIKLDELFCNNNKLTSLNVDGLKRLIKLYCQYNFMNASALDNLFTSLQSVGWGQIVIRNNGTGYDGSGTSGCKVSIAEEKGWHVITN